MDKPPSPLPPSSPSSVVPPPSIPASTDSLKRDDTPKSKPSLPPPPQPPQADQSLSGLFRQATDRFLIFLSNASNETLGACLVGLGASTYFVFGRFGLVLIGVVGGVVLHATWENSNGKGGSSEAGLRENARRREVGLDVANRILAWREKRLIEDSKDLGLDLGQSRSADFSDFRPETAAALNQFTDAVVRDYVKWWYSPVIPEEIVFPQSCRKTLSSFILALSSNLARKRAADTFIEFTTNSSSIVIVFLNELTQALAASPSSPPSDAIQTYLRLKPESNLASITDVKHQNRKLQSISDDILESYLDPAVYRCTPARVFLQKILAHIVLEYSLQRCSQADWINDWIVYLLEEGEPELLNVIDAGVEKSAAAEVQVTAPPEDTAPEVASPKSPEHARHHSRTFSRAEEAMDEAMREAARLTQMIKEEDQKRQKERESQELTRPEEQPKPDAELKPHATRPATIQEVNELSDTSETTSRGIPTPSSSQSGEDQSSAPAALQPAVAAKSLLSNETNIVESPIEDAKTIPGESKATAGPFTSFDQLSPSRVPTALTSAAENRPSTANSSISLTAPAAPEPLTLHKARVVIFDDSEPIEKKTIKSKPTSDYLIQIEPASSSFPGWMIPRTYIDFEVLHEVLVRISKITGINFGETHPTPPVWKNKTKHQLRQEMERYLNDAMKFEQLAESEGMKRFLDKARGMTQSPQKGFWPNPANMTKGMFDALAKAPNHVAGGGKAILGGVSNVFTGGTNAAANTAAAKRASVSATPSAPMSNKAANNSSQSVDLSSRPGTQQGRASADSESAKKAPPPFLEVQRRPGLDSRRNSHKEDPDENMISPPTTGKGHYLMLDADDAFPDTPGTSMKLPPPPDDIADDYAPSPLEKPKHRPEDSTSHMSADGTNFFDVPTPPTPRSPRPQSPLPMRSPPARTSSIQQPRARQSPADAVRAARIREAETKRNTPLSETEAQVTIELLFAVITELYTLSSAWTLRRTLLGAAKTFLLRPGNPQLESIRVLVQESVLDANTSDAGIAAQIFKLRENTLPTEAELARWPKERTGEEKERLRSKARELLVRRGMPQALTSVMGQAASGEALAKVFDCLQDEHVARGLMFGLLLQAVRALTQ